MLRNSIATVFAVGLSAASITASAGEYQTSVMLPVVYAKNYDYRADLPVKGSPPATARIKNVSWNWTIVGWPDQFSVKLCAGTVSNCIDISRQRLGSTSAFFAQNANVQFFYVTRAASVTLVPVVGQEGKITVQW